MKPIETLAAKMRALFGPRKTKRHRLPGWAAKKA